MDSARPCRASSSTCSASTTCTSPSTARQACRLAHPEQFGLSSGALAANETCNMETRVHLSPRDKLHFRGGATYAQDPFSIAGLGLLLRPGQSDIFVARINGDVEHALSGHSEIDYGLEGQALAFGSGDPGNGYVLAPNLRYAWKTSARSKWDVGGRDQLFFGVGAPVGSPRATWGSGARACAVGRSTAGRSRRRWSGTCCSCA